MNERDSELRWTPVEVESPQVTVSKRMLTPKTVFAQDAIRDELMHRLGPNVTVEMMREQVLHGLIVRLTKTLTTHRLKSHVEDVEAWIDAPYEVEVMVEPEPRWYHRWYKPEPRWITVKGKVKCRGKIKVRVDHLLEFPDSTMAWPEYMGRPVSATEVIVHEDPRWTRQDPVVDDRPWAAERWSP